MGSILGKNRKNGEITNQLLVLGGNSLKVKTKQIVLAIIWLSIVLSVVFGRTTTGQARIAVYMTYLCIGACLLYSFSLKQIKIRYFQLLLLLFGIVLSASTLYSPTNSSIVNAYILRYWISFATAFLIANVIDTDRDIHVLINACIVAGVAYSAFVYSYYGIKYLLTITYRIDNTLGNQNEIGMYCAFSIILSVYEIFNKKNIRHTILYIVCIIVNFPALLVTGSRKALLIAFVGFLAMVLTYNEKKGKYKRLIFAILILSVVLYFANDFAYFVGIHDRFIDLSGILSGGDVTRNDAARLYWIREGWKHFLNSPVFGNGFLSSYAYFNLYSHNNFIELLMDNGIIGFALYYAIHFRIMHLALKKRSNNTDAFAFVLSIMIAMVLVDVGVVSFYNSFILILLLLCVKRIEFIGEIESA